jgi:hypothetical protein
MTWTIEGSRQGLEYDVSPGAAKLSGVGTAKVIDDELPGEFVEALRRAEYRCTWSISPGADAKAELNFDRIIPTRLVLHIEWPPATYQAAETAFGRLFLSEDARYTSFFYLYRCSTPLRDPRLTPQWDRGNFCKAKAIRSP